ncbi:MAG: prepilin peptidase [Candidatus Jorgensenbacteria bacterium]|nr:prepilin peptidase [Candidatus Jorgensenbacteria bacterium]
MPITVEIIAYGALFIIGSALGSFLNVLSMRYAPERSVFAEKSIGGRSHCMKCKKKLTWFELFPLVSFAVLRGKCRSCGAPLSIQYPIIEFLGGLIAVAVAYYLNSIYSVPDFVFASLAAPWWHYALLGAWILVFIILLLVLLIDLKHYVVPNELNVILGVLGIIVVGIMWKYKNELPLFSTSFLKQYSLFLAPTGNLLLSHVIGAFTAAVFFALLSFASRGQGMGFGDVKLALASGFLLGWPDMALAVVIAFILGGIFGAYLLISGRLSMKDRVPFAPFFVIGIALVFFFGEAILKGYFTLFGL